MTDDLVQRLKSGCKNIQFCKIDACCCPVMEEAADRIEELEFRISAYDEGFAEKLEQIHTLEARLAGVDAGTHVIVPVDPTNKMLSAGVASDSWPETWAGTRDLQETWKTMIRTAQEKDDDETTPTVS